MEAKQTEFVDLFDGIMKKVYDRNIQSGDAIVTRRRSDFIIKAMKKIENNIIYIAGCNNLDMEPWRIQYRYKYCFSYNFPQKCEN